MNKRLIAIGAFALACQKPTPPTQLVGSASPPDAGAASASYSGGALDASATREIAIGAGGVGFDDLVYAASMGKLLVPAGASGNVVLVDPTTLATTKLGAGADATAYKGGHGEGTTSADEGRGFLFSIDRTAMEVRVIDPKSGQIASSAKLASGPDYVRFVASASEVWVTEPDAEQIEVFSFSGVAPPRLSKTTTLAVKGGPESLVVDDARHRAFSNTWKGSSVVIDTTKRAVTATYANGCEGSRGLAFDGAKGMLFVGCAEGKVTSLDVEHGGKQLGSAKTGAGVDIIAYAPSKSRLYAPGGKAGTLTVVSVASDGSLRVAGSAAAPMGSHCAATDDHGTVFVCDPNGGKILVVKDTWPE